MADYRRLTHRSFLFPCLAALSLCVLSVRAGGHSSELAGASPGERSAIEAVCGDSPSAMARDMCVSNQLIGLMRLGRKPDLSVATPQQRADISAACAASSSPGERFACEREHLSAAGLPVRNEPGGGSLHTDSAAGTAMEAGAAEARQAALPYFSLTKWRAERPPMPPARGGPDLSPSALYDRIAPAVYVVLASDHAVELAERTTHAQGSAIAIASKILVTNCHVVAGRPQISISQDGETGRATVIYADPGGDRCFLRSETLPLHPIEGVRTFDSIHVGETVFSMGAPVGLERSFGQGMVSGLRQSEGVRILQNSAPSWHGSSGGGLFDARGNLVGITTAGSATVANLNFAIAAEDFWP